MSARLLVLDRSNATLITGHQFGPLGKRLQSIARVRFRLMLYGAVWKLAWGAFTLIVLPINLFPGQFWERQKGALCRTKRGNGGLLGGFFLRLFYYFKLMEI